MGVPAMPRYHFALVSETDVVTYDDQHCRDASEAMRIADTLARRLVSDEPLLQHQGYAISVTDHLHKDIYRADLDSPRTL